NSGTEKLLRYMSVMLRLLAVLFIYLVFGASFDGLLRSVAALQAGNNGNEHLLGMSYVVLVLQYITDVLPYAFNVPVIFAALRLLDAMRADRYSAETVAAVRQLSKLCAAALAVTLSVNIGFNLFQFLSAKSLIVMNGSVQLPVFSITFVLAVLLISRLVTENKQLKDDVDMFI
ncbi:MAG: hypothetical protein FWF47_06890, partial [Clostridia bacterium]|nr:hypothetical protein [Clostridia bacterium]